MTEPETPPPKAFLSRARTVNGRPVLIYALLEHKSVPDPRTDLQLLGY
jgi:hypothetical protein